MDEKRYESWKYVKKWITTHYNDSYEPKYESLLCSKDMLRERLKLYFGIPEDLASREIDELREQMRKKA
jgi:hypothetical protein